ncbi:uncharacterized protein At5g64816-like [Selaginella moellendorffii]|uniref:uncharacterized protein At5g64816-like n=1 Tax=Selaginella moellendorffii TaxID=88036 RepID=UPI000D1CF3CE|nr:uncharacterized protein At5g64816-like [Selaginella moellendorffii]|eukprot:XP_024534455.1 uncharacterized protein At5g64816-like [Selaginella moellendorffii]
MVEGSWWSAAVGLGLGLLGITGSATMIRQWRRGKSGKSGGGGIAERWRPRRSSLDQSEQQQQDLDSQDRFACKRVCASDRMMKRVGSFAKDVTPNSCVTVCGVSDLDACAEACARSVCSTQHHVPNWNDVCMRRCQSECLRS